MLPLVSDVGSQRVLAAHHTDPFQRLLSENLAAVVASLPTALAAAFAAGGSNVDQIVKTAGLEPASANPSRPSF